MLNLKTIEQYKVLPVDQRINELKKWMEKEINSIKTILRSTVLVLPDGDTETGEALTLGFEELPLVINDYSPESAAAFIIKYRIEHNIEVVEDEEDILNLKEMGKIVAKEIHKAQSGRSAQLSGINTTLDMQQYMDSLRQICTILGFEEELDDLNAWRPNL